MTGTVLVTGGSGYIAGFLIRQLVAEGWHVNTTVRSLAREAEIRRVLAVDDSRLSFFAADLLDDAGWAEAVAGCSHVAHVASPFPAAAVKDAQELIRPASASGEKPPNTTEWIAPIRAHASTANAASGIIGR